MRGRGIWVLGGGCWAAVAGYKGEENTEDTKGTQVSQREPGRGTAIAGFAEERRGRTTLRAARCYERNDGTIRISRLWERTWRALSTFCIPITLVFRIHAYGFEGEGLCADTAQARAANAFDKQERKMEQGPNEIEALKRRVKQLQVMCSACLLLLVVVGLSGFSASRHDSILRVRGLVIEDEQGRPRILLGAPTPTVAGRKRAEPVDGLVLLGPNGADRFVASYPGYEPQVQGKVGQRQYSAPSAGLMINDVDGNERIGLGTSDDGTRSALGMDYSDRDALGLLVSPGFSGVAMFARSGPKNDQITMGVTRDGVATAKLADSNGDEGIIADVKQGANLKVQARNPKTSKLEEVGGRLFP